MKCIKNDLCNALYDLSFVISQVSFIQICKKVDFEELKFADISVVHVIAIVWLIIDTLIKHQKRNFNTL